MALEVVMSTTVLTKTSTQVLTMTPWNALTARSPMSEPTLTDETSESRTKRPRGILTEDDRKFLREKKYTDRARDVRYRIRQRIKNALGDFELLTKGLKMQDRKMIFLDTNKDLVVYILSFVYLGIVEFAKDYDFMDPTDFFSEYVKSGIMWAEAELGYLSNVNIDVEISREQPDAEQVLEKIIDSRRGSAREWIYLEQKGKIEKLLENIVETDESVHLNQDRSPDHRSGNIITSEVTPEVAQRKLGTFSTDN